LAGGAGDAFDFLAYLALHDARQVGVQPFLEHRAQQGAGQFVERGAGRKRGFHGLGLLQGGGQARKGRGRAGGGAVADEGVVAAVAGGVRGVLRLGREGRFADRLDRERVDVGGRGNVEVADALGRGGLIGVGQFQHVLFRSRGLLHRGGLVHQGGRGFGGGGPGFGGGRRFGDGLALGCGRRRRRSSGLRRRVVVGGDPADRRQDFLHRRFLGGLVGHVETPRLARRTQEIW